MATLTADRSSHQTSFTAPVIVALVLAATASFFLGRATAEGHRDARSDPGPAAVQGPDAGPASPPPWSQQGFQDDARAQESCLAPECNG